MKNTNTTPHLASREKQCSASRMDIGLQGMCNEMGLFTEKAGNNEWFGITQIMNTLREIRSYST